MSRDEAFLRDIIEHADDDAPRLIYADWLDEHGRPDRAEFIRIQCELARLPEDNGRREALRTRELELLEDHGEEWASSLPGWASDPKFERGFVASVSTTAEDFLRDPASLWRVAPVTGITVLAVADLIAGLAACPYLARLRSLSLSDPLTTFWPFSVVEMQGFNEGGAVALASSPHLGQLRRLTIGAPHRIEAEGAEALARCSGLGRLRLLALWNQGIRDAGVVSLAASTHLRLTTLDLGYNQIGVAGARALAGSHRFAELTSLNLNGNSLNWQGTRALANSAHLNRLVQLKLAGNEIGPRGARALAATRQLKGLTELSLFGNELGREGLAALATGRRLARLRRLELRSTDAGDAGVSILAASSILSKLWVLDLTNNGINDAGAQALAASAYLTNLRRLSLQGNQIRAAGARALAKSVAFPNLLHLDLIANPLRPSTQQFLQQRFGDIVSL